MDPFVRSIDLWTAFGAGVFSFASPCILPIIPSYMFFISGTSAAALKANESEAGSDAQADARSDSKADEKAQEKQKTQRQIILSSLCFILGFSLVFIALGATATGLGAMLKAHQDLLRKIGGGVVIVMGLHMMGLIQINALLYEKRVHLKARPPGYLGAFLIGLSFALGWTPCIGPQLGTILAIASTKTSVVEGIRLLAVFSLGLAIPFFITALLMDKIFVYFRKLQKHMQAISVASGAFLILVGILIFTNFLQTLSNFLQAPSLPIS
ncbi:MAG: cytochrome c biogenesis protein CcdA [Candidatus Sericytochromatia bacterium]|nr:cytochrome c biogenesis protein CcdA [Candidatus Sericytochromatia bacterium]